jgi:hypothetical protein
MEKAFGLPNLFLRPSSLRPASTLANNCQTQPERIPAATSPVNKPKPQARRRLAPYFGPYDFFDLFKYGVV